MDEKSRKRQGPFGLFRESRPFRLAVIAAVILTPTLYVLSSGPMRSLSWRGRSTLTAPTPDGRVGVELNVEIPDWWEQLYAPLFWVSEQPWGEELIWGYWELLSFPTESAGGIE
jgi:hypothetical protein